MKISLIVAMAKNGAIGLDNGLPWRLPGDMRYFKATTMGKPVIMGRKTWQSIGRPLPGRTNIVITRQRDWLPEGDVSQAVRVVRSLDEALSLGRDIARADGAGEVMVMGGAEIYRQALPGADRIYLTEVAADVAGDAFFPALDNSQWRETHREAGDPGGEYSYAFVVKERSGC